MSFCQSTNWLTVSQNITFYKLPVCFMQTSLFIKWLKLLKSRSGTKKSDFLSAAVQDLLCRSPGGRACIYKLKSNSYFKLFYLSDNIKMWQCEQQHFVWLYRSTEYVIMKNSGWHSEGFTCSYSAKWPASVRATLTDVVIHNFDFALQVLAWMDNFSKRLENASVDINFHM